MAPGAGRQTELKFRRWGGRRNKAGRKPGPGRRCVAHRRRAFHIPREPVHVTLRAAAGLPSLRGDHLFIALRGALAKASHATFRVLQFSAQADHVHLIVEADRPNALSCGVQGLAIRIARAINRTLGRRGRVWGDRFHAHALATPREVRNALVYVLNNVRKHIPGVRGLDPRSSAAWFGGWKTRVRRPDGSSPVAEARTWLARVGWLRWGGIGVDESPRR
jgi:putative transposase